MKYRGLIITGTRGSGKSFLDEKLSRKDPRFKHVKAVTTRSRRSDDRPHYYEYVDEAGFSKLRQTGDLLIEDQYGGNRYGVRISEMESVVKLGSIPILTLTPASARMVLTNFKDEYLSVFLDADDTVLDERLRKRGSVFDNLEAEQRKVDRELATSFVYVLQSCDSAPDLLIWLWEHVGVGGILPSKIIDEMMRCGLLLQRIDKKKIKGASYDLSLGEEYFYGGTIHRLSDDSPLLTIGPYDYAIVTSREACNFPLDVSGRFDLSVGLFCQGIILSNGPQVDPGFRGPLFCLLFNTSSSSVTLKKGQHYATLEFHKLIEPTFSYEGKYLGKSLVDYLPANVTQGAINVLKKELDQVRNESRSTYRANWIILAITVGTLGILVTAVLTFVTYHGPTSTVTTTTTVTRSSFSAVIPWIVIFRGVVSRLLNRRGEATNPKEECSGPDSGNYKIGQHCRDSAELSAKCSVRSIGAAIQNRTDRSNIILYL